MPNRAPFRRFPIPQSPDLERRPRQSPLSDPIHPARTSSRPASLRPRQSPLSDPIPRPAPRPTPRSAASLATQTAQSPAIMAMTQSGGRGADGCALALPTSPCHSRRRAGAASLPSGSRRTAAGADGETGSAPRDALLD